MLFKVSHNAIECRMYFPHYTLQLETCPGYKTSDSVHRSGGFHPINPDPIWVKRRLQANKSPLLAGRQCRDACSAWKSAGYGSLPFCTSLSTFKIRAGSAHCLNVAKQEYKPSVNNCELGIPLVCYDTTIGKYFIELLRLIKSIERYNCVIQK